MDAKRAGMLEALEQRCLTLGPLAVAFSGGLDSRFLCYVAKKAGVQVRALHVQGPHISPEESDEARQWAAAAKIPFTSIMINPLEYPEIRENGRERCYYCKHALFSRLLRETAMQAGVSKEETLCDGTNVSDHAVYRPGLRALSELDVVSPLADAGLDKEDIRFLAQVIGMDRPWQQARPCLLTRFDYGVEPDIAVLAALSRTERALERVLADRENCLQAPPFRLRFFSSGIVLHVQGLELAQDTRQKLSYVLKEHGFDEASVECISDISGYFDRSPIASEKE